MDERTHFFIKIYLSYLILERFDVGHVWEVSWGQTATYWPQVLLTIAALLPQLGWAAQPWVTDGPKPSVFRWFSRRHLANCNWLTQAVCGTWLCSCLTCSCFLWAYASATITEFSHVQMSRWYSDIFDRMLPGFYPLAICTWGASLIGTWDARFAKCRRGQFIFSPAHMNFDLCSICIVK